MPATPRDYAQFRSSLLGFIESEIIGPKSGIEVISKMPTERYASGLLYPQPSPEDSSGVIESRIEDEGESIRDEEDVSAVEQSSSFYPSAMGLSYCVNSIKPALKITLTAGQYEPVSSSDFRIVSTPLASFPKTFQDLELYRRLLEFKHGRLHVISELSAEDKANLKTLFKDDPDLSRALYDLSDLLESGWKRREIECELLINIEHGSGRALVTDEELEFRWIAKQVPGTDVTICTLSLVNNNISKDPKKDHLATYCQVVFSIEAQDSSAVFAEMATPDPLTPEKERESLELLYRNKRTFATGHGCSASWGEMESGSVRKVFTTYMPTYEIPSTSADLMPVKDLKMPDLSIKLYANGNIIDIISSLSDLVTLYRGWIASLTTELGALGARYQEAAKSHIADCTESADRMQEGINLIKSDPMVERAFRLANLAMLMQIRHSAIQKERRTADDPHELPVTYDDSAATWRPFQIAFLMQSITSIVDDSSEQRNLVDLIWFPTGGGKTEAYLGLTAFTIVLRKLRHPGQEGAGTTVMMRYTLRLLTAQQFQRACTLICALEKIRRTYVEEMGKEAITIGLWLGANSTPNTLQDARTEIGRRGNAFQILSCPWCGTHMTPQNGKGLYCYRESHTPHAHLSMFCPNRSCDFTAPGELPIKVVDDDIYKEPPTLLFGTVDKFAMLPWKENAASIFALESKDDPRLSPELIIQDELHLISGALGTMVGIYETAVDMMCSRKGRSPKIVASTATIRRASEQCMALYGRQTRQFPAPGLSSEDSFFAREIAPTADKPGRLYVGVMPTGKTSTTMEVRLVSAMIQGPEMLDGSNEVKDKYWTEVIYCNSIRELGTSKSIIYQDVEQHSRAVARRAGKKPRYYSDRAVEELTGRASGQRIPAILQQLDVSYPDKGYLDVLLATSMISVGVDIDRLSQMLVLGQPKTTSEYIQASSRVGRKFPGLVVMQYSPTKSRDRSHFEKFTGYHQSLYKEVEPTSVTPFAPPARDKALYAVLITLIRHLLGLHTPEQLRTFDRNSPDVQKIVDELAQRVDRIDERERTEFIAQVNDNLDWISVMATNDDTIYGHVGGRQDRKKISILRQPGDNQGVGRATPTSMRNTDAECYINVDYFSSEEGKL